MVKTFPNNWKWVNDNSSVSWYNWYHPTQPNGDGNCARARIRIARVNHHWDDHHKWYDVSCWRSIRQVICEKPVSKLISSK